MLKGLALRQAFLLTNIVLGIVLAVLAALITRELFRPALNAGPVSEPDVRNQVRPLQLAKVQNRAAYDAIVARGLLGPAGAYDPSKKPPPPAPEPTEAATTTRLPLKLLGVAVVLDASLSEDPRLTAAAIIEVGEPIPQTSTFYLGDEIISNVYLKEVHPREVILDNRRTGQLERLELEHGSESGSSGGTRVTPAVQRVTPRAAVVPQRQGLITLERDKITKRLEDEYARIASRLNVQVVKDDEGKVQGITTDNIEQYDVAKELGFQNGDVLVSVNNEPVDSREKAAAVLQKYQNASIFRIGILRNGQPQYLTYRVK